MKYFCLLLCVCCLWSLPAAADGYAKTINVDVTAQSAAVAKEKAMAQANRQAVNELAPDFTKEAGLELLSSLSDEQILYFIKDVLVLDEKSSDVRYIATLKVTIRDDILRQYLQEKGLTDDLPSGTIDVLFDYSELSEWLELEKNLKRMKNVEEVAIVAMMKGKIQFKIEYLGEFSALLQEIDALNMSLNKNGNIYVLNRKLNVFSTFEDYNL
ncbi:MAG: hypothetical protein IJ689_00340 [Alphaproteobacteria bacterium]|nr:hypothetical protein [Alphaproteobacteria bacterium]